MKLNIRSILVALSIFVSLCLPSSLFAQESDETHAHTRALIPSDCGEMEAWDFASGMCQPLAMKDMPMRMFMVHGNLFVVQDFAEGTRGRNALSAPNMIMADLGSSVGDRHYINLDLMLTLEKWTFPRDGYPELLQIGEENRDHKPYIDAQHPHSSPLMGLTLSDTYTLGGSNGDKNYFKLSFAPRGQSTDGPVAFMHRATGIVNPDAPLGHHLGQDAGHITSTVLASTLHLHRSTLEASTFNGTEPEPDKVDLPMGPLNSYAFRFTQEFSDTFYAMASAAYVRKPESHDPDLDHIWRYSASLYNNLKIRGATLHNTFIYGLINFYDHTSALNSFSEEFLFTHGRKNVWTRIEFVERTAAQLQISIDETPRWVSAMTLGYTYNLAQSDEIGLGLGASITKDFLPVEFESAYGGDPWTGKIFLQLGGMTMRDL